MSRSYLLAKSIGEFHREDPHGTHFHDIIIKAIDAVKAVWNGKAATRASLSQINRDVVDLENRLKTRPALMTRAQKAATLKPAASTEAATPETASRDGATGRQLATARRSRWVNDQDRRDHQDQWR